MRINYTWIFFLVLPFTLAVSQSPYTIRNHELKSEFINQQSNNNAHGITKYDNPDTGKTDNEQIISVRITSSVAVGRGRQKSNNRGHNHYSDLLKDPTPTTPTTEINESYFTSTTDFTTTETTTYDDFQNQTDVPSELSGANIEFIKQLQAKKEVRGVNNFERVHQFNDNSSQWNFNETEDSVAESSIKSILELNDKVEEDTENVPLARSIPLSYSSKSFIHDVPHRQTVNRDNVPGLTTVSFNVVHDSPKPADNYQDPGNSFLRTSPKLSELQKYYNEPSGVYSQPAQVYSEPAKFYSEPAKIYSEPAKIYSEPAKVYSEPAKIYSEPAKFYSQPASLHLDSAEPPNTSWLTQKTDVTPVNSDVTTTPVTSTKPTLVPTNHNREHQPEQNYEVDEKVSVMTDGRSHGVQPSNPENCKQENCKVGYVVEGRQFRKYRVEERTSDGFIVGEYGVVRNEDGALRGVRYTADSDASPRLIHDALMKFLQLK